MPRPATKRKRTATTKKSSNKTNTKANITENTEEEIGLQSPYVDNTDDVRATNTRIAHGETPMRTPRFDRSILSDKTPAASWKRQSHSSFLLDNTDVSQIQRQGALSTRPAAKRLANTTSKPQKRGTPAVESSILSAFRPRPRQPSILQIVENDSSGSEDEDFLGPLEPNDESTPLPASKRKTPFLDSIGMGRRLTREQQQDTSPTATRLEDSHVGVENPVSPSDSLREDNIRRKHRTTIYGDVEDDTDDSRDESLPSMATTRQQATPVRRNTTPPPESSYLAPPKDIDSSQYLDGDANGSDSPSEEMAKEERIRVPTAALREKMLPRRRKRAPKTSNRGFSPLVSEDEEGEDSDRPVVKAKTKRNAPRNKNSEPAKRTKLRKKTTNAKQQTKPAGDTSTLPLKTTGSLGRDKGSKNKRMYSRRTGGCVDEDKENQPSESLARPGSGDEDRTVGNEELLYQKEKFLEVDQWSIDFEDVPAEECSPY